MIRSFIALDVECTILDRLADVQQQLRSSGADVSWSRPEGMHLTLKFLGDVPEEQIADIGEALALTAGLFSPFRVTIAGTGAFPTLRRPRVIWAGVTTDGETLQQLAGAVDEAMAGLDFPREDRAFRAHLTLGRVRSPRNLSELLPRVEAYAGTTFGSMVVRDIVLMRSELLQHGARYSELRRIPLAQ